MNKNGIFCLIIQFLVLSTGFFLLKNISDQTIWNFRYFIFNMFPFRSSVLVQWTSSIVFIIKKHCCIALNWFNQTEPYLVTSYHSLDILRILHIWIWGSRKKPAHRDPSEIPAHSKVIFKFFHHIKPQTILGLRKQPNLYGDDSYISEHWRSYCFWSIHTIRYVPKRTVLLIVSPRWCAILLPWHVFSNALSKVLFCLIAIPHNIIKLFPQALVMSFCSTLYIYYFS